MKDFCKILLYVIAAEILTLFIDFTLGFSSGTLMRLITAICTVCILAGLMAQAGYSIALSDKKQKTGSALRGALLGITAVIPYQICWVLLLLARLGMLSDTFYRTYKLLCAPFLAVCNLFSADVSAQTLPIAGLCVLEALSLVPFAAVFITYQMTRKGKTLEEMMY